MDWLEEARGHLRSRRKLLFDKNGPCLAGLNRLLAGQNHRTQVLWALDLAEETVAWLEGRYAGEGRPRRALECARAWSQGRMKMRQAQRAILDCHALARELTDPGDIALCHGVGQACGVVHTGGHAIGLPMYELTALVRRYGLEGCRVPVEARRADYLARLLDWQGRQAAYPGPWADFLLRGPGESGTAADEKRKEAGFS